jgi:hypothetical protein
MGNGVLVHKEELGVWVDHLILLCICVPGASVVLCMFEEVSSLSHVGHGRPYPLVSFLLGGVPNMVNFTMELVGVANWDLSFLVKLIGFYISFKLLVLKYEFWSILHDVSKILSVHETFTEDLLVGLFGRCLSDYVHVILQRL